MKSRHRRHRRPSPCDLPRFLVAALLACICMPASAQDDEEMPPWLDVVIVRVEGGESAAFEDLLGQLMAARAESGLPASQVFSVVRGHPNEYHIVTPVESMASNENAGPPMPAPDMAVWMQRVTQTIDSVRFFYARTYPEHAIAGEEGDTAPELLVLRTTRVVAGRGADYEDWVAQQLMPAMRQADVTGHTMSRGAFGDSEQNFYHAIPVADWAELDGPDPLMEALGEERMERMLDDLDGIVESSGTVVAQIRPDLAAGQ